MEEKYRLPGWLYVPLIALLLLVLHQPWKQMSTAKEIAEAKTLANVPMETYQQLFDERRAINLEAERNKNRNGNPMALSRFLRQRSEWDVRARK